MQASLIKTNLSGANLSGANGLVWNTGGLNLVGPNPIIGANLSWAFLHEANLCGADLRGVILRGAELWRANLGGANLTEADLSGANLAEADLGKAYLHKANISGARLIDANLSRATLSTANISGTNLTKANLTGANLEHSNLVDTDLSGADVTGCRIYGVSAWDLKIDGAKQQNLVVTRWGEPEITVDNIEVAQFVYLLLHNQKIRDVIDTITSKAVLILGRFTDERKAVLNALREELRKRDYLPILFDFEKPRSRDTDETITLLARLARFVIADVTDAKAVLQELRAFVPDLSSLPVQPIILAAQKEPGMFDFYRNMPWFLKVHHYVDQEQLLADLSDKVIRPAELKVLELRAST